MTVCRTPSTIIRVNLIPDISKPPSAQMRQSRQNDREVSNSSLYLSFSNWHRSGTSKCPHVISTPAANAKFKDTRQFHDQFLLILRNLVLDLHWHGIKISRAHNPLLRWRTGGKAFDAKSRRACTWS